MPLTNPSTAFDEDGWADAISDIRKLYMMIQALKGGANDLNNTTLEDNQIEADVDLGRATQPMTLYPREIDVCVDGTRKQMFVLSHGSGVTNTTINPACEDCEECAGEYCLTLTAGGAGCPINRYFVHNTGSNENISTCEGTDTVASGGSVTNPTDLASNVHYITGADADRIIHVRHSPASLGTLTTVTLLPGQVTGSINLTIVGVTGLSTGRGVYAFTGGTHTITVHNGNAISPGWNVSYTVNIVLLDWASGINASPTVTVLGTASSSSSSGSITSGTRTYAVGTVEAFLAEEDFPSNNWALAEALTGMTITLPTPVGSETRIEVTSGGVNVRGAWDTTGYPQCLTIT